MPKDTLLIFNSFNSKINTLDAIRKKIEKLYDQDLIAKRDVEEVYSAIFLDAIVYFEAYIEELFVGLLTNQFSSNRHRVSPRIKVRNSVIAREIIFNLGNYFDWFPYSRTEKASKVFFKNGIPFTSLTSNDKDYLGKCLIIRNAIAHKSDHSRDQFNSKIISGLILNPRDKKPKSFLRKQFSQNPNLNYYQQYILIIQGVAQRLY